MPSVFVTSANGHIGQRLVPALLAQTSHHLVLPTRNPSSLSAYSSKNVTIAEGTIQDPQWVEKQLQTYNCSTVFICLTGTDELMTTLNIFSAIERVGCVKHIIYVSAAGDFRSPKWAGAKILSAHCAVKFIIEDILAKLDGVKYSIVGPSFFTSNDLRGRNSIVKAGLYPEPVGKIGASRVNVDDIADAVVKLVLDGGERWGGKKIDLGSRAYNEVEMEEIWSAAMGRPIKVLPIDEESLDKVEKNFISTGHGPDWGRDIRLMYVLVRDHGLLVEEERRGTQVELLGREPRSYEDHVKELATKWLAEEKAE